MKKSLGVCLLIIKAIESLAFVTSGWQLCSRMNAGEIKDNLIFTKPGEHVFRLHWLLMDGEQEMINSESEIGIRVKSKYGWIALNIKSPNSECRASLAHAGELIGGQREVKPYEGWISPTYGTKVPALSLAVEVKSLKSFSFISEFIFPR